MEGRLFRRDNVDKEKHPFQYMESRMRRTGKHEETDVNNTAKTLALY